MGFRISSQEKGALFRSKILEGKNIDDAAKEVKRVINFENDFYNFNKERRRYERKILLLEEKLRKSKKDKFKEKFEEIKMATEKDNCQLATTRDLSRIVSILESEGKIDLQDVRKVCLVKKDKGQNALSFLLRLNYIKQVRDGRKMVFVKC